ncbi:uncharacterized protein LOC141551242 [Sminthopsis crassicaudata]|uniref:uncharacterized protein LOC141551242 n=1 Tax=Sminthopsis crassicaudata TaxID=9301 RepID=UPI003D6965A3
MYPGVPEGTCRAGRGGGVAKFETGRVREPCAERGVSRMARRRGAGGGACREGSGRLRAERCRQKRRGSAEGSCGRRRGYRSAAGIGCGARVSPGVARLRAAPPPPSPGTCSRGGCGAALALLGLGLRARRRRRRRHSAGAPGSGGVLRPGVLAERGVSAPAAARLRSGLFLSIIDQLEVSWIFFMLKISTSVRIHLHTALKCTAIFWFCSFHSASVHNEGSTTAL